MNGLGSYKWQDGRKYEGYWQNNIMEGVGVYGLVEDSTVGALI